MTPAEFRTARLTLGWTQRQLADYLGVSAQTVKNYEAGRHPVPTPTARLLDLMVKTPKKKLDVDKLLTPY
jgi:transcriptional regulator with XRE-family HTH domain